MSVQATIKQKLTSHFQPKHLEVENESGNHNVPPGSESHFKVTMVSGDFEGKRAVARHQAVYAVLAHELKAGVHALALHLYTQDEWALQGSAPQSPNCLGAGQ